MLNDYQLNKKTNKVKAQILESDSLVRITFAHFLWKLLGPSMCPFLVQKNNNDSTISKGYCEEEVR